MKSGNTKRNSSLVRETESKKSGISNGKYLTENKMKNNERKTLLPVKVCEINLFPDNFGLKFCAYTYAAYTYALPLIFIYLLVFYDYF